MFVIAVIADHEIGVGNVRKSIFLIETLRARVVAIDAQDDVVEAA